MASAALAEDQQPRTVCESNADFKQLQAACKNTMHFACKVLMHELSPRLQASMLRISNPLRVQFGKDLVGFKTLAGTYDFNLRMSMGGYISVLCEVWAAWTSPVVADALEFVCAGMVKADPAVVDVDRALCHRLFGFCFRLVAHRLETSLTHSDLPPLSFFRLLQTDEAGKQSALATLAEEWACLQRLERSALLDASCAAFVRNLSFPASQLVREYFVMLDESEFAFVPERLQTEVAERARAWTSTKIVEDMMNKLRSRGRVSKANFLGRAGRWQTCLASSLLSDNGRGEIHVTKAAKAAPGKSVPNSLFSHMGEESSLTAAELHTLGEEPQSWASHSPGWRRSRSKAIGTLCASLGAACSHLPAGCWLRRARVCAQWAWC